MSRPIYEPSLPRTDAELGYGNRQLFRRPAPLGDGGATTAALLTGFNFENVGDELVAADTWELVTPGDGSRYFEDSWRSTDGGFNVFFDGDSSFSHNDFALYVAYADVTFQTGTDGTTIGAAIQYAASSTHFYANTMTVVGNVAKVTVSATWWATLADIRLWCYTELADEIGAARFVVRKFELDSSGEYEARP